MICPLTAKLGQPQLGSRSS